jgi:hypothetical protein
VAVEITAKKISDSVAEGFRRVERFRKARAFHIKSYVGQYMAEKYGVTGDQPINLMFLAVRTLIPNLVQKEGITRVMTRILRQRDYAEKLGLALTDLHKQLKMKRILRSACVDMCFGPGILKTSIAQGGQLFQVDSDVNVDHGQIYTEAIDLDDFTLDPCCVAFDKARFLGHRIRIERAKILEADGFNKDLVRRLPRAGLNPSKAERADEQSKEAGGDLATSDMQDYVNVVELWVPEAEAVCYIPDPAEAAFDDFLKVEEYYGPPSGCYSFGALTQPVPGSPFPIAPVGVWRDLSDMANRLFKKAMNQADRQKNVTLYQPSCADVAEAIRDAEDGECIATESPDGVKVVSYEGAGPEATQMVNTLYGWFNVIAGNPDLMGGLDVNSDKATGQQILQQNASIGVGDMRDMVYDLAADVSEKQAWFIHNDELMFAPGLPGIPLIKREAGGRERQLFLTPEDRTGDVGQLGFEIVSRSMSVVDPATRARLIHEFTTNILPQAFMSLQVALQAGQPFNLTKYLTLVAEEMGIAEMVDEIFTDPDFQARMQWYASTGGKSEGKGQIIGGTNAIQNGGFPVGRSPMMGPQQQFNQGAQATAAAAQSTMQMGGGLG